MHVWGAALGPKSSLRTLFESKRSSEGRALIEEVEERGEQNSVV